MDMRKLVGLNVRRARKRAGLTQEELAERSGYGQQYISTLERGLRNPTVITVHDLANALGVNYLELLLPIAGETTERKRGRKTFM